MKRHTALAVLATALAAAPIALAAPADAAVRTNVTYTDRTGDTVLMTPSKVPLAVRKSIDLKTVNYTLDRTRRTLRITYRAADIYTDAASNRYGVTQMFSTDVVAANPNVSIESTNKSGTIRILRSNGRSTTCGRATTDAAANTHTQVIPLSCLPPSSGSFSSGVYLFSNYGPLSYDSGNWISYRWTL